MKSAIEYERKHAINLLDRYLQFKRLLGQLYDISTIRS